jgi:[ribosomal protein S5]-alanine N-acetyltransferase
MRWLSGVRKTGRPPAIEAETAVQNRVQPVLQTKRLTIRPFAAADAVRLSALAGKHRIADTTVSIPHPYSPGQALEDIHKYTEEFNHGTGAFFALALREAPLELIGGILIKTIDRPHAQGELGYWIDDSYTGHGYVTEAGHALLDYGFHVENLNRICAYHMVRNQASGKVLARLGMKQEGHLRQLIKKWDVFEDVLVWSILRDEFDRG